MPELIDRQALLEAYDRAHKGPPGGARKLIAEAPEVEAEPVRCGRWIPTEYDSYADGAPVWDKWECSDCGHEHSGEEDTLTAFCPDCGARMDATDTDIGGKGGEQE